MRKLFHAGLAVCFAITASGAIAQEVTLRMAILGGVGKSGYGVAMSKVPDAIYQATNGRVQVEIYDSLIPGPQLPNALRDGTVDMIGGVHVYMSGEEPRLGIGHLPGLLTNEKEYKNVLDAYMGELIAEVWDTRYNGHALTQGLWYEAPVFSNELIVKLEDFRGLKVRTHNYESAGMLTQVGAKPTQVPAGEMVNALQRGVIDALSAEYGSAVSLGVQDAAKYASLWDFSVNLGWTVVMNNESWASLPEDLQVQITEGMKNFQEERFANYIEETAAIRQEMIDAGIELVEVPETEQNRALSDENVTAIYDDWYARAADVGFDGKAVVQKVRDILGK
ncbi:MAG: TRAP transporter substrate-binding protein DctP [Thiohalobacteraceae bacterium]|uniref:TRAP transporter substrate-binding protein n=1 Tax=Sulfitobacter sp. MOLA879 TaxID=3368579 RepID=UPI0035751C31